MPIFEKLVRKSFATAGYNNMSQSFPVILLTEHETDAVTTSEDRRQFHTFGHR